MKFPVSKNLLSPCPRGSPKVGQRCRSRSRPSSQTSLLRVVKLALDEALVPYQAKIRLRKLFSCVSHHARATRISDHVVFLVSASTSRGLVLKTKCQAPQRAPGCHQLPKWQTEAPNVMKYSAKTRVHSYHPDTEAGLLQILLFLGV